QVALTGLPGAADFAGGVELRPTEYVRMPSYQLLMHPPRNLLQPQLALLRQEKGKEVHLEQQVAQLVRKLCVIPADRRVGNLVRLFDGVRDDRPLGLLSIPWAVAPQPPGQLLE